MRHLRLLLLAALFLPGSCANQTDPVTGEGYFSPIGNDYESQLKYVQGQFITQIVTVQDGGNLTEPEILAACQEIFDRIVEAIPPEHRRNFRFDLKLSASPSINAYTYGAGFVRANLGLLARCGDASEFAGIVAHELGHNSHDHVGQSIGRAVLSQEVLGLGGIAGTPGRLIGNFVGGDLARFTLTQYTRSQETAADQLAVVYTTDAGIDPDGLARFFGRLETEESKGVRKPQLFQSHPYSGNRVAAIREQIAATPGTDAATLIKQTDAFAKASERARFILPYYESLNTALQGSDTDAALAEVARCEKALPTHAAFPFWAATILSSQDKPAEAVVAIRRATALDDGANFLIPLMQATLELETRNPLRAERAADRLIKIMPALPHGFLLRGLARLAVDRNKEARADFDQALRRVPTKRDRRGLEEKIRERLPDYKFKG